MKRCVSCGAEIEDKNKFCPHCGTRCDGGAEPEKPAYPQSAGKDEGFVYQPSADGNEGNAGQPYTDASGTGAEAYPMKWHKFLMVVMIIGAVFTAISGLRYMTGMQYTGSGLDASSVYFTYPGLKSCDIFYGAALIAIGVFEIIVRNRLNRFSANGPGSLKLCYILGIAANLIYLVWASSVTGVNLLDSTNLGSVVSSVALLIINSIYYSRRKALFVN